MPTKKKPAKKQAKESAFDRLFGEIDDLMFDVATVADKLLDLLPKFKKLKIKDRRLLVEHMQVVFQGFGDSVWKYATTLPEYDNNQESAERFLSVDNEHPPLNMDIIAGGLIGMALGAMLASPHPVKKDEDETKFDWPDAIDVEGKVKRKPKLLRPKE